MKNRYKYEGPVLIDSSVTSRYWRGDVEAQSEKEALDKLKRLYLNQFKLERNFRVYFPKSIKKMEVIG